MTAIKMRRSLQSRLLTSLMGVTAVAWFLVLGLTWYETDHELNELLDAHLAQTASFLVVQSGDGHEDDSDFTTSPTLHKYQPRVAYQVWHEGQLVARSEKAPITPFRQAVSLTARSMAKSGEFSVHRGKKKMSGSMLPSLVNSVKIFCMLA